MSMKKLTTGGADKPGPGFNNIRKIVEKYNGHFKISNNNNEFIAELFI